MAAFNFHRRQTRRWWYVGTTLVVAAFLAVVLVGGASANLGFSTFEGGDGNLIVDNAGNNDWNSLTTTGSPALHIGAEQFSGTQDNSFGQGTKENNSNVTLVQGSIPPNKSDLTVFYEASEQVPGYTTGCGTQPTPCDHTLIYLAWERSNVLGSANMDFEINQTGTPCMDSTGPFPVKCTINRTSGDILVTYDFTNGGGTPTVGLRTWNGSTWQPDTGSVVSESAVNSVPVTDGVTESPTNGTSLAANEFGEASIDLTGSGVLGSGACGFGQATTFLKSRSSASFTSEIKDYVAPVSTPLVQCKGAITVTKEAKNHNCTGSGTSSSGTDLSCISNATQAQAGAGFTFYKESNGCLGLQTATVICHDGGLNDGLSVAADTTAGTGTTALATGGVPPATTCLDNLDLGTYYVRETTTPTGFATQADQTVSVSTAGDCTSGSAAVNFTGTSADQPLTKLTVNVDSVVAGASNSSVSCVVGTAGAAIGNSPQPATGKTDPVRFKADGTAGAPALPPGTYTCTVVIDP
jgi:prealbumin domain-containing protein